MAALYVIGCVVVVVASAFTCVDCRVCFLLVKTKLFTLKFFKESSYLFLVKLIDWS